jgi:N6-L-threonylcarbamoyladenine synthase
MTRHQAIIMGVETSCDETGVALVEGGTCIRSNVVASSEDFHRRFGGVVPEIASRKQVEVISAVARQALDEAGAAFADIDAVAVTYAPGLVGSLVVGVCFAKAVAFARALPLVAVHHIEAHIYAHFLVEPPEFPFLALVVSGGHSDLIAVRGHGEYEILGRTRDDAAGEAFDKGARLLGLGYPGGPAIDAAARQGDPRAISFPRAVVSEEAGYPPHLRGRGSRWDFSFSGVKTALARYVRETPEPQRHRIEDLAASYQEAVVEPLVEKSVAVTQALGFPRLLVAGGVAGNSRLRELMTERAREAGVEVRFPPLELCGDNAAMVASAGYFRFARGKVTDLSLDAYASANLGVEP